jgi:hypothetical protein
MMKAHVFRGPGRIFGVTADAAGAKLPAKYAPWTAFKEVELQRGERTPGLHVEECLDDLEKFGVHVTDAHVRITEQALAT